MMLAGKLEEAQTELTDLLDTHPEHSDTLFYLSLLQDLIGNPEQQKKYLDRSLRADPDNIQALGSLGEYYIKKKEFQKAVGSFRQVLEHNPDDLVALLGMSSIHLQKVVQQVADPHRLRDT